MMYSSIAVLSTLFGSTLAAMGPSFGTGPVASGSFITSATSTLNVPEGNLPFAGYLSLWVGMGTSNGDLIQSIVNRHPGSGGTICEDVTESNQWCGYAYTLKDGGDQVFGTPQVSVVSGDTYQMQYTFDSSTGNYNQNDLLNGQSASTLSTSDGEATGWGTAVECAATDCGTVPAHTWTNTVIVLSDPDPNYGSTLALTEGATSSGFSSSDGGTTWTVQTISIPEFTFTS